MKERIQKELERIEEQFDVRILYACESGSRAWGFESTDSDWDVRFIYLHKPAWYLSIEPYRDVIECPVDEGLDVSGWDFRKALNLFRKSNPPMLEWLDSPVVYKADQDFVDGWRALIPEYFSPKSCTYHYLSMAKHNYREHMRTEEVKLKKYLYILRPVLGCLWLARDLGPVPMRFETLVETIVDDRTLKADINQLVAQKKAGTELGVGTRIPSISNFLESEFEHILERASELEVMKGSKSGLDEFFIKTLKRYYPEY